MIKRLLIISMVVLFTLSAFADKRAEVTVIQAGIVNKVNVYFDNGNGKPETVKKDNGDKFESPVAVVNYFKNKGWQVKEMHVSTAMANTIRIYVITKKEE